MSKPHKKKICEQGKPLEAVVGEMSRAEERYISAICVVVGMNVQSLISDSQAPCLSNVSACMCA